MKFKKYFESIDIFGFENKKNSFDKNDALLSNPINQFDIELMMSILSQKKLGFQEANCSFFNEIKWGNQPGSLKLEVDTGYTFYLKQLGIDKQGNPRWVTKKMFQLNRQGYGGTEDAVAQEVFEQIERLSYSNIESPKEDKYNLGLLVDNIYKKIIRTGKSIFIPEGIKKMNENYYIIKFGLTGAGLESPDRQRVEQNQTSISYDENSGTIRVANYNIESPVGGKSSWRLKPNDLDLYFFPTQDRDEISEAVAVHMKYY